MFRAPGSSDPPSTPGSRRSLASNPSTTPAGPPPSYREPPSFTPIGPPPPSVLGSSFGASGSRRPLFQNSSHRSGATKAPLTFPNAPKSRAGQIQFGSSSRFQSSPPQPIQLSDDEEDIDGDAMEEVEEQGPGIAESLESPDFAYEAAMGQRGTKRARNGESLMRDLPVRTVDTHGIAKGIAASQGPLKLQEPDTLVLETERLVEQLSREENAGTRTEEILDDVARDLQKLWLQYGKLTKEEVGGDGLGPIDDRNVLARTNFVASLLLRLYQPTASDSSQELGQSQMSRSLRSLREGEHHRFVHMPQLLFEWLDQYHNPAAQVLAGVLDHTDGYAASPDFWDCVYSCIFRGNFQQVIDLLQGANLAVEGHEGTYSGQIIDNIEQAIEETCELLANCPAVRDGDWDIKGATWAIFRQRVRKTLREIREFAEGDMPGSDDPGNFSETARSSQFALSTASRRAESHIPYEIYEPLQDLYKLLMGEAEDLSKSAYDWVEATIGLTAWWDGEDERAPRGGLALNRQLVTRTQHSRPADVTPALAYRQRLAYTLAQALDDREIKETFDASDPIQIALASVFQSDIDSALMIMKGWSMTMTASIAELADAAGWLPDSRPGSRDALRGLDPSDLMVLSYGNDSMNDRTSKKDEILVQYADLLTSKAHFQSPVLGVSVEGWQLALTVLARVDDVHAVDAKVNAILDKIPLDSSDRVNALLNLCANLSFTEYGTRIAEKYADQLSTSSSRHGSAILYYARAHNAAKVKETINVLISLSLIQSLAYPPSDALDDHLRAFVTSPKHALQQLAAVDTKAAQLLSLYLSGYATLRDFYDRRDDARSSSSSSSSATLARKRVAAPSLLASITSASECITGGLFDPTLDAIFPVDSLLLLLGEALPLVNQSERILTNDQLFTLLRLAEDLQAVSPKIFQRCEELLKTAIANAYGADAPSPRALLRKRESSGLAGSGAFSLVGSVMSGSQVSGRSEGSGVLVRGIVRRGWDWRPGLAQGATGEDVLRVLRFAVAQEVGKSWSVDEHDGF